MIWRDTNIGKWGGWISAVSFPLMVLIVLFAIPVEGLLIRERWDVLLVFATIFLVFCFLWLRSILVLRKTAYKIVIHSDEQITLYLHFNRTITTSIKSIAYVTPFAPLSVKELMTETASTRNREYVVRLSDGSQCRVPYSIDDLETLLKSLSGDTSVAQAIHQHHDDETREAMINANIYGICVVIAFVIVGGLLAITLLPFIEDKYGKESAASFTLFVWLPSVIFLGTLAGAIIGYLVIKYRSGKKKALEALIGK